ncbi:3-phosphoserine/phosphohydroxythreonine transaminase [Buchnera aphidicola]|uniref:3-phosphoserine/phosphohydroxythreonine transaminase n=1 Tax=Buchnera aphidicola TaxID=9 RepID=UPI0031B8AC3B
MKKIIYNFSAGPAMLPKIVLRDIQKNFLNWNNIGSSIIEISHRSQDFYPIIQKSEKYLRELLNISQEYAILFCPGGARGQFSAIPMNIIKKFNCADYINSGYWSYQAMLEGKKYCSVNCINIKQENEIISLLNMKDWELNHRTDYLHYCPNETIEGIAIHEEPIFEDKIIVGDFSSCLLSKKIDVNKYDLIYASAQKNIGPSGITVIIIKKKILNKNHAYLPSILDYKKILENQSMFNTPVTFSWYVISLVLKWMKDLGGISYFEKLNIKKSNLLYKTIDSSSFYINKIHKKNRSNMNITFHLSNSKLDKIFIKQSEQQGLKFLKGHKFLGGLRASIYNAMPITGVKKLIKFMKEFEKNFG